MNYRHDFHAGNFADLVKHACLLSALRRLIDKTGPILVIDTHAGAGVYDLTGAMAVRSGESDAGVVRLLADAQAPRPFAALKAAVGKLNPDGGLRFYPGSPWLIAWMLRPGDRLIACELRPDDRGRLERTLFGFRARVLGQDGYAAAASQTRPEQAPFVLIDPPFERPDDYERIATTVAAVLRRNRQATILIWLPLKDLETFDAFLRRLEAIETAAILVCEARLHTLDDPMRMNGCAMVAINPPDGFEAEARVICDWAVQALGGNGAEARCWRL